MGSVLFLKVLSISLTGSVVTLLWLLLRHFCCRWFTKKSIYQIGILVMLLFLLPFSVKVPVTMPEDSVISDRVYRNGRFGEQTLIQIDDHGSDLLNTSLLENSLKGQPYVRQTGAGQVESLLYLSTNDFSGEIFVKQSWLEILAVLWLLGVSVSLISTVAGYRYFTQQIGWLPVEDIKVLGVYQNKCTALGLSHAPLLFYGGQEQTALTMGLWKPRIIIPKGIKGIFLEHIIVHELTHYQQHHLWGKWLAQLVVSLHWFNPVVHILRKKLDLDCELACDELICRSLRRKQRQEYGLTLLAVSGSAKVGEGLCTAMSNETKALKARLAAVKERPFNRRKRKKAALQAFVLAVLLLALGLGKPIFVEAQQEAEFWSIERNDVKEAFDQFMDSVVVDLPTDTVSFVIPEAPTGWQWQVFGWGIEEQDWQTGERFTMVVRDELRYGSYFLSVALIDAVVDEVNELSEGQKAREDYRLSLSLHALWHLEETSLGTVPVDRWETAYAALMAETEALGDHFSLYDIDCDGVPELIWGARSQSVFSFQQRDDQTGTGGVVHYRGEVYNQIYAPAGIEEQQLRSHQLLSYGGFGTGIAGSGHYVLTENAIVEKGEEYLLFTTFQEQERYLIEGLLSEKAKYLQKKDTLLPNVKQVPSYYRHLADERNSTERLTEIWQEYYSQP